MSQKGHQLVAYIRLESDFISASIKWPVKTFHRREAQKPQAQVRTLCVRVYYYLMMMRKGHHPKNLFPIEMLAVQDVQLVYVPCWLAS